MVMVVMVMVVEVGDRVWEDGVREGRGGGRGEHFCANSYSIFDLYSPPFMTLLTLTHIAAIIEFFI